MIREEEIELDLNKLNKGKIFVNYTEMCFELGIEWNPRKRNNVLKNLEKYCSFDKQGHKIIIKEVYKNEILKCGYQLYDNVDIKQIYGVIYKIENKINNKVYIGQTIRKNGFDDRYAFRGEGIERVYGFHRAQKYYGDNYNQHLLSSIEKYGFDAFEVNKVFDIAISKEELDRKEKYWIKYFKSTDKKFGYNHLVGGEGYSEGKSAYLSKLGISRKPILCIETMEVFLTATEVSRKLAICDTTVISVCKGKFRSAYSKVLNQYLTFEYIELENHRKKAVICITTNKRYKNVKIASKENNISIDSILKNCLGNSKSAGKGYVTNEKLKWKFLLDFEIENKFCIENIEYIEQANF